jgi:hypothetical protein
MPIILVLTFALGLGACAATPQAALRAQSGALSVETGTAGRAGIPGVMQPHGGKTAARAAGFGAMEVFVK